MVLRYDLGMTANEMQKAVGKEVWLRFQQLNIRCKIADVKMSYGRPRLLVWPVAGMGEQWVELDRVVAVDAPSAEFLKALVAA
jgi:hypothetical protein